MAIRTLLLTLAAFLVFPAAAPAFQGYVQTVAEGATIAWGSGDLAVSRLLEPLAGGAESPSPLTLRKAVSNARKQLLDTILGIRIDAHSTVGSHLSEDAELAARVRAVIQNSPLERPAMFADSGEIRVTESLRGKLAELILPTIIQFQSGIAPKLSTSMEQSLNFEGGEPEHVGSGIGTGGFTGVIVDARGLKITPALTPVIFGQDGQGAYGAFLVSRQSAIDKGVVAYAATPDPQALRERVGDRPLTVKALSAYGSWRTDLIISTSMARLVRAVMRSGEAVNDCRVVIVLDPPQPDSVLPEPSMPESGPDVKPVEEGGNA
ncbi:MAG: hypothetical protein V3571_08960 [Pseudodesulfovibrio sp.]